MTKKKTITAKTANETPKQTAPLSALGAINTTLTENAHARLFLSLGSLNGAKGLQVATEHQNAVAEYHHEVQDHMNNRWEALTCTGIL